MRFGNVYMKEAVEEYFDRQLYICGIYKESECRIPQDKEKFGVRLVILRYVP